MEKEYIITVTLKDGTKVKIVRDYSWGFESELNDTRKPFKRHLWGRMGQVKINL